MKTFFKIFNVIFLGILSIVIFYFIIFGYNSPKTLEEDCVDVDIDAGYSYEACYDAYSKKIFLGIKRGYDSYEVNSFRFKFFDFSERVFDINKVPAIGGVEAYRISADKNPMSMDIYFDVNYRSLRNVCEKSRRVFVGYCPERRGNLSVNVNPLEGIGKDSFVDIGASSFLDSDSLAMSLVDKERIWGLACSSVWECSSWEMCENGVQKRNCKDLKNCFIPTSIPENVRHCDGSCRENWECFWSKCTNGFSTPTCRDLNNCGTSFNIPKDIKCSVKGDCIPSIECSEWSECMVDYDFFSVNSGEINSLGGTRSRTCRDKNSCVAVVEEAVDCSLRVDVYTKLVRRCGVDYIGIYNKIDDSLIVRIDKGTKDQPRMNINIDDGKNDLYCDYCYDGILNGDETDIDCGGSCMPCSQKYG
jgi:hypothetical protein